MRKEMAKENKFLFMKLVDIQNGKHPMLKFDTVENRNGVSNSNDRYSGLAKYSGGHNLAQNASTQRLSNSHSRPLIQSAKNNYQHFIREKNYANELSAGERSLFGRHESPQRSLHEHKRRQYAR